MSPRESILIELAGVRRLAALLGFSAEFAEVCLGLLRELHPNPVPGRPPAGGRHAAGWV